MTLSIFKDLLVKAKHLAVNKGSSLSGLLTATLEEIVSKEEGYKEAHIRQAHLMGKGLDLGLNGKVHWGREKVYERY